MTRCFLAAAVCASCALLPPPGRAAAVADESAVLRQQIQQLEAQNKALWGEFERLKGGPKQTTEQLRVASDRRRLGELAERFREKPDDQGVRKELAALAERLALAEPDKSGVGVMSWDILLKSGVLKDGLSRQDAEKLLGPPTEAGEKSVGWYFNPMNRHVAPYLHATATKDGLTDWKLTRR